jgi:hypothetical protein
VSSFVNPVIEGLVTAMQIKHAMQQASLQREDLARRKARDQREDQLTDFNSQIALMDKGAKPLAPGQQTYAQNMTVPDVQPWMNPAAPIANTSMQTQAPVDQSRVVQQPGSGKQFYIPTPDEQFADQFGRHIQQLTAETDVKTQAQMRELATKFGFDRSLHDMDNASKEGIAGLNREAEDVREKGRQKNQKDIADAANTTREKVAKINESGAYGRTVLHENRADERQDAAEKGKNGRAQKGLTENVRQSKVISLQREDERLGEDIQKLHEQRLQDGGENAGGPKDRFSSVASREGAVKAAQDRIEEKQRRRDEIKRSLKLLEKGGGGSDNTDEPANPFRGTAVANPYRKAR